MDDKIIPKFAETILGKTKPEKPPSDEGESTALARRGIGQDLMLELRFKNGAETAFSYAFLSRADHNPDEGIRLTFAADKVRIEGSDLRQLFSEIITHKRSFIEEYSSPMLALANAGRPQVTRIVIFENQDE
jgi:hypothetical protein